MASSLASFFSSVFLPEPLHNDAAGPEPDSKPDVVDEADASEVGEVEPEEEEAEPQDVGVQTSDPRRSLTRWCNDHSLLPGSVKNALQRLLALLSIIISSTALRR
jgi:hypothetical protein